MTWDAHAETHTKPLVDKWDRAMEFLTGTTTTPSLFENQRDFVLCQTIDLDTTVCTIGLCLALQMHCGDQLFFGAEDMVKGHNGPHLWRKELRPWLEKTNGSLDSSTT